MKNKGKRLIKRRNVAVESALRKRVFWLFINADYLHQYADYLSSICWLFIINMFSITLPSNIHQTSQKD